MPAPNEITVSQLNRLIGTPDCPQIIDICLEEDFADDPFLIPGSWRHSHHEMPSLVEKLTGRAAVIVCQKGRKLSQGVAAWLRSEGVGAEYLQGGMYEWRNAPDMMRIPYASIPGMANGQSLWVTRHRPKIDRIACPWLIRRFVDPFARFLFVAPAEVEPVAERFGATPFDIEGAFWSHRGATCTFDTMLEEFGLSSSALSRLSDVIRAADTNRHDLHSAAPGLLALSVGLSRQFRDDLQQLDIGMLMYDALYRWARDGHQETHDWPAGKQG